MGPEGESDKQRIAELEAEVARLKAEAGEPSVAEGADRTSPATRAKMVVTAAIILVVALGLFSVVFFVLSKGFTSFARKAAETIVPGTGQGSVAPAPRPPTPPEREPGPIAPGL